MKKLKSLLTLICLNLLASTCLAGSINLSDLFNGGAPFIADNVSFAEIIETNGGADPAINFMQNPLVFGDRLDFNPVGLRAQVVGDVDAVTFQTEISLLIAADPGSAITGLCFHESGDFSVDGDAAVEAVLNVSWENETMTESGMATGTFVADGGNGIWQIDLDVPVTGNPDKIQVTFENILTAEALDVISAAFIAKKQFNGLEVKTEVIPEPAGFSLGAIAWLALARIRRRHTCQI